MLQALSLALPLAPSRPVAVYSPAPSVHPAAELSDDDLEQVVGGLARTWSAGAVPADLGTAPTVTYHVAEPVARRIPA